MRGPAPGLIASLRRELVLACDRAGRITWLDANAGARLGVEVGADLLACCLRGTEGKLRELLARAGEAPQRGWELCLLVDGAPTTLWSTATRDGDHLVVVAAPMLEPHAAAIAEVSRSVAEIVELNRVVVRQKRELEQRHAELERVHRELAESNRGVLSLHQELADRAHALQHSSEIKSRVVSSVSHEFRTPLHSILGLTQLLLERSDGPLTDEQAKQVRFVRSSAEELIQLVNDLLDLSRLEAGRAALRAERFELDELLGSLRGSLRPLIGEDAPVDLTIDDAEPGLELETDRAKLSQILRNLISNAIKFTPRGTIRVQARAEADTVTFTVRDTGIGIAAADLERIFEEFGQVAGAHQDETRGTGLGLSISRKLAELLGGSLTASSEPGVGSTFTLVLPRVHEDVAAMHEIEVRNREPDPTRAPVLVVEDDRKTIFVYERYLAMAGFQVLPARSIADARRIMTTVRPLAIVLDVMLEEETTWDFLAEVKRDPVTHDIPVLVVTVTNREEKARALGADEFWLKPIDADRLARKLASLARGRHSTVSVLLIDDDPTARYLVARQLAGTPYQLIEASTAEEGVALAHDHLPSVILLDFLLDQGTAFDVLDELKADPRTRTIPVIIVTSHALDAEQRARLARGADAVISKQNLSRELAINRIRDALRKRALPQGES